MTHSPVTLVTLYLCAILTHFQVLLSLVDVIDYVIWELFLEIGVCNTEQHYPLSLSLSLPSSTEKWKCTSIYSCLTTAVQLYRWDDKPFLTHWWTPYQSSFTTHRSPPTHQPQNTLTLSPCRFSQLPPKQELVNRYLIRQNEWTLANSP